MVTVVPKAIIIVIVMSILLYCYFNSYILKYLSFYLNLSLYVSVLSSVIAILIKSGVADKAAIGFLLAAALPILLAISNALSGLLATFFPKLTAAVPKPLKESFKPSASIVASLTVIDLLLLHLTQLSFNILVPLAVKTPRILLVPL